VDAKPFVMPQSADLNMQRAASVALDTLTGKSLPPALDTGIDDVDFEHGQLLSCMATLRQLCADQTRNSCLPCSSEQRMLCESSLIGILGDLLIFILDHFHTEEKAMRQSLLYMLDREICEAHMEDHAHISEKIQQIVAAIEPDKTVLQVRELTALLENWMTHHVELHDKALARWMARQNSVAGLFQKA
jgi:hemerythrin-like metal-binding protein